MKVHKTDGCWEWTGSLTGKGYGQILCDGRLQPAHRVSLAMIGRMPPAGMDVDHLCRNRRCVRPEHLDIVTRSVNVKRALDVQDRSVCRNGHARTPDNLRAKGNGRFECKMCRVAHGKKYRAQAKESIRALASKPTGGASDE